MVGSKDIMVSIVAVFFLVLAGCGGGDGGSSENKSISGIAADGLPIASATVSIKDKNGVEVTGTTNADGSFSVDLQDGMTGPFLVRVDKGGGNYLYSYCASAASSNTKAMVHPYSDVINKVYFLSNNVDDLDTLYDTLTSGSNLPSTYEIDLVKEDILKSVRLWLEELGCDPSSFDLLTTEFTTDSTGFDALLDYTLVTIDTVQGTCTFDIDDLNPATLTSSTNITTDNVNNCYSQITDIDVSNGTEVTSYLSRVDAHLYDDIPGLLLQINSTLSDVVNVVNSHTAAADLEDTHLINYLHPDFLDGGYTRDIHSKDLAECWRGLEFTSFVMNEIIEFEETKQRVYAKGELNVNGMPAFAVDLYFMHDTGSGNWLFSGKQRDIDRYAMGVEVGKEIRYAQGAANPEVVNYVSVMCRDYLQEITALTVEASNLAEGYTYSLFDLYTTKYSDVLEIQDKPEPAAPYTINYDGYERWTSVAEADLPPSGTDFVFTVTTAAGTTAYSETVGWWSTAVPEVSGPAGFTLADANLGGTLTVDVQLPKSIEFTELEPIIIVSDGTDEEEYEPVSGSVSNYVYTASFDMPADLGGSAITYVEFNMGIEGMHGEHFEIRWEFQ